MDLDEALKATDPGERHNTTSEEREQGRQVIHRLARIGKAVVEHIRAIPEYKREGAFLNLGVGVDLGERTNLELGYLLAAVGHRQDDEFNERIVEEAAKRLKFAGRADRPVSAGRTGRRW